MEGKKVGRKIIFGLGSASLIFALLFIIKPNLGLSEIENPELKMEKITHSTFIKEDNLNYTSTDSIKIDPGKKEEIYLSPIYRLENPTDSIGLKWQESALGPEAQIWLKVYEQGWSNWIKVEKQDLTETPDQANKKLKEEYRQGEITSKLIFCIKATKFQYKIRLRAGRVKPTFEEISFYGLGEKKLPIWKGWFTALLSPDQTQSQVKIISRQSWGANEGWTKKKVKRNGKWVWKTIWPIQYTRANKIIIHHDGNARNLVPKSTKEARAWIQGIYNWHARGLGWGDIGYNYLIDPWGNIYQGRKGADKVIKGKRYNVIAGHTYGQNRGSIGVCILGNYQNNHQPTGASLNSLAELAGNKAFYFGFSPTRIYGHKDLAGHPKGHNYTACPGKNLYKKRGYLRNLASKYSAAYSGKIPNNTLIKPTKGSAIYLVQNNKKRPFLSFDVLKQRGYQGKKIITLPLEIINKIPTGGIIVYRSNTLIRQKGKSTVEPG